MSDEKSKGSNRKEPDGLIDKPFRPVRTGNLTGRTDERTDGRANGQISIKLSSETSRRLAALFLHHKRLALRVIYRILWEADLPPSFTESALRNVLSRWRKKGLLLTDGIAYILNPVWGSNTLIEALEYEKVVRSQWILDRPSSTLRKIERSDKDEGVLEIEPRDLKITDIFDTKQARFEKQEFECRIDEHIARHLHKKAFENRPSKNDRSKKVSHSEESFTLVMTHKGWMKITPKRPDYLNKVAEWASKSGLSTSDVLLICRDMMNQIGDMTAILEIPAKQRLPDGEGFYLKWKYEGKIGEIEYVRTHKGEIEVRSGMSELIHFMEIFAGTTAAVWPEFSALRENVKEQLESMKKDLDQDVFKELKDNRKRLAQLEKTVQQLIGLITKYLDPQPQKASNDSEPDYIG